MAGAAQMQAPQGDLNPGFRDVDVSIGVSGQPVPDRQANAAGRRG
jgi:hypothetical protein